MTATRRRVLRLALVGFALAVGSCAAGPRVFVSRDADMTYYRKLAVLPFANLTGDTYAGGRVTRAFVTELVIAERFQLVDPAQFVAELERAGAPPDAQGHVDPQKLKEVAAKVGATGVIRGAVTEYQMGRSGADEAPVVSFDTEMVDAETGSLVWRVSVTRRGKGRLPILGGSGTRSFGSVTQEACAQAVERLRREAF